MKKSIPLMLSLAGAALLPSCLISQAVNAVVRDEYPGPRPPSVIADAGGKPASNAQWQTIDHEALPPSGALLRNLSGKRAADGILIGGTSEYSNIVISPHAPNYQLDYRGFSGGQKVWDPYTRKPFYIPRSFTVN